jgi:hypothetical protein
MGIKPLQDQSISPFLFVQVQQHLFFKLIFPVIDCNRVVVSVQPMNKGLTKQRAYNLLLETNKKIIKPHVIGMLPG